jgi:hypothetical protein
MKIGAIPLIPPTAENALIAGENAGCKTKERFSGKQKTLNTSLGLLGAILWFGAHNLYCQDISAWHVTKREAHANVGSNR